MENYFNFFNEHWVLTLEFIIIIILALTNELYIARNRKKFVLIDKAVDLINHQNAKIFDVRESSKFNTGYIKNSFNVNTLDIKASKYIINKYMNNCIIICSNKDINTSESMRILKKEGMKKIYILKGGIQSWTNAGFPVIKKKAKNLLNK